MSHLFCSQQPSLPGENVSSGKDDLVDTDSRVHSSLLFPLLLIFPSIVDLGFEIFQDFSHHLGDSEMEILSKMCSLVFMLCKSENKTKQKTPRKQNKTTPETQFATEWDGVEQCPCMRKKNETFPVLHFSVWEIL